MRPPRASASKTFRNSAGFGKRIEYWIVGRMLKEGMDVYMPLVDDHAVDAIVRRGDGSIALIQIKARSVDVADKDAALFAAIVHEHREHYWFIFYSERLDLMWIMTSEEFVALSNQNKTGKNAGKRSIWFNGRKLNRETGKKEEYCLPQWQKFLATNFERIRTVPEQQHKKIRARAI